MSTQDTIQNINSLFDTLDREAAKDLDQFRRGLISASTCSNSMHRLASTAHGIFMGAHACTDLTKNDVVLAASRRLMKIRGVSIGFDENNMPLDSVRR